MGGASRVCRATGGAERDSANVWWSQSIDHLHFLPIPITDKLYHILNHYNMFGGGYYSNAVGLMEELLRK